jgi:NADPH-dependent 2,4-dienoyl-CoA reductase/sulfur reductase-like enzyme
MRRYVLVGSGVASIAAVEAIRCHDPSSDILLVGEEPYGFYTRPGLAYYLTGELSEAQLYPVSEVNFRQMGIRRLHARAVEIKTEEHFVKLANGNVLPYDRLLIATGAEAQRAKSPGIELDGVVKLDCMDDARGIIARARRARAAVVVGGGITALEIVEALVRRRVRTHYFLRGDRDWTSVLDETESRIVEHRLLEEGVKINFHTEMAEVLGKGGRVVGVRTQDGRTIPCDIVAVAIGVRARTELAKASGIHVERGVRVNDELESSATDVFAAGDAAEVFDPLTGKTVMDTLWTPAREQGYAAGLNMAGITTPYHKPLPFNVTRLADLTTTIIGMVGSGRDEDTVGIVRGDSETWREIPDAIAAQADFDVNRLRLLVGKNTLLGAIVMGDQTLSRPLQHLITQQIDITPLRSRFIQAGRELGELVANFWTKWRLSSGIPAQQP